MRGFPRVTKCIAYPNRTRRRVFKPRDAGRIVCAVLADGGDPKQLREELDKCFPCEEDSRKLADAAAIGERAQVQEELIENSLIRNIALLAAVIGLLGALLIFLRGIAALPLVGVALAPLGVRILITRVAAMEGRVIAQRAANEATRIQVREAANAARFLQRAGAR